LPSSSSLPTSGLIGLGVSRSDRGGRGSDPYQAARDQWFRTRKVKPHKAARQAAVERERSVIVESSVELLREIAGVLDVRAVFPRVSEIANKVLPHEHLTMMFDDGDGHIVFEAASADEFPDLTRLVKGNHAKPDEGFIIVDDLTTATLPIAEPADLGEQLVAAGYRSLLVVMTRARDQAMSLIFWSKRPGAETRPRGPLEAASR